MKILYVAKHNSGDNDDEGAIAYSLRQLGHEVKCVDQRPEKRARPYDFAKAEADLLLCHGWPEVSQLAAVKSVPKVCWFFDIVSGSDPHLNAVTARRKAWLAYFLPQTDLMFMTDGDWVAKDRTGKLVHLMQGADPRVLGPGSPLPNEGGPPPLPLLFAGNPRHGVRRQEHVAELRRVYGDDFEVLGEGGPRTRLHGRALADRMARAEIVIAPDGPSTDRYWSNRVYQALGFGAFLLHPYCHLLTLHYEPDDELVYYHSRADFYNKIEHYRSHREQRERVRAAGFVKTVNNHTYLHRCRTLIETTKGRLGL